MSIRLWLMVADCWQCGASIELTEDEQREALGLLSRQSKPAGKKQPAADRPATPPAAQAALAAVSPPREESAPAARSTAELPAAGIARPAEGRPAAPEPRRPARWADTPQRRVPAAEKPGPVRARLDTIRSLGEARLWVLDRWRDLPCWLASLVLHMLLIILLGLWSMSPPDRTRTLVLATQVNDLDRPGEGVRLTESEKAVEFDEPGALVEQVDQQNPFADLNVKNPARSASHPLGQRDDSRPSASFPSGPADLPAMLAGRHPLVRSHLVETEGGTIESEAAVARGLQWLARHQEADGSWDLRLYCRTGDCDGQCDRPSAMSDSVSGTALGLLPFLGAGQTHLGGVYRDVVADGLAWLVKTQQADGGMPLGTMGRMYGHALASIALAEAYGMTRDESLREPAQRALDFIAAAQNSFGGWRYEPGQRGDVSVTGWQIMALRSGRMAYLNVSDDVLVRSAEFLDSAQVLPDRAIYGYMPGYRPAAAMTAEGLLARQYAGWSADEPLLRTGVDWLMENFPPDRSRDEIYYWYYATQVMHHVGGATWQNWNLALRDTLVSMQETTGHQAGSWPPSRGFDYSGGRLYVTSLSICTLEVYYRHMPLYRAEAVNH